MKIHEILPVVSLLLTFITIGLTYFVRRWSLSTFSLLLVLATAVLPSFAYLVCLRSHYLHTIQIGFRFGAAGEIVSASAILLFSLTFARKQPLEEIWKMGIPLTLIGLGSLFSVSDVFFEHHLFRIIALPANKSVLLINNTSLSTLSFFLTGILVFSLFQLAKTYLSAEGLERWNIKYPMIGVFLWSFALILVHTNQVVNNGFDRSFLLLEHAGLILLDGFFLYAFLIQKAQDITLALSRKAINRSVLILLGGAGLLVLGGIGSSLGTLGPIWSKLSLSLMIFLGVGAFTIVFSSERLRRELEGFLGIHFYSNRYDYRAAWMTLTQAIAESGDLRELVPTLIEQTREITLAHSLVFGQIPNPIHPSLAIQESSGWKPLKTAKNQPMDPSIVPFLSQGVPVHESDHSVRSSRGEILPSWKPLFQSLNASWILPLVFQGKLLGILGLGIKSSGSKSLFEDRLFLQALSVQWVSHLVNATLSREMAWSRETDLLSGLRSFTFHDLKNAGVALKLLVHNAQRNIDSPEFQKELLFCLQNISQQIDSSMEQLLSPFHQDYSRLSEFNPTGLIRNTIRGLQWTDLPELHLNLHLADLPAICANPKALETTLRNLLINAREALQDKGEITVETLQDESSVSIIVSDNGPGMSREFIENRLFRPFQTTKKKGTGLGLFSCRLLIEQSGGTIQVNSKEGEGTEFVINLKTIHSKNKSININNSP
ncbi:MAG: ATP-binding protein [Leptospirales bacterium]